MTSIPSLASQLLLDFHSALAVHHPIARENIYYLLIRCGKEDLRCNGSVHEVSQNSPTLEHEVTGTKCYGC